MGGGRIYRISTVTSALLMGNPILEMGKFVSSIDFLRLHVHIEANSADPDESLIWICTICKAFVCMFRVGTVTGNAIIRTNEVSFIPC